jgi:hypothetical protein
MLRHTVCSRRVNPRADVMESVAYGSRPTNICGILSLIQPAPFKRVMVKIARNSYKISGYSLNQDV